MTKPARKELLLLALTAMWPHIPENERDHDTPEAMAEQCETDMSDDPEASKAVEAAGLAVWEAGYRAGQADPEGLAFTDGAGV